MAAVSIFVFEQSRFRECRQCCALKSLSAERTHFTSAKTRCADIDGFEMEQRLFGAEWKEKSGRRLHHLHYRQKLTVLKRNLDAFHFNVALEAIEWNAGQS
jgi:hypothetical protein